ncbi:nuclear transport factor 2 family protein [Leptothoe sp. EHU-05/26/07-4]
MRSTSTVAARLTQSLERSRENMTDLSPKAVVQAFVDAFNSADVEALASLYAEDAVNHQVAETPVNGRSAIRDMFAKEFATAQMTCIPENLFEDGEWAILEWRDPLGLRGCGFFQIVDGKISFQRGYWDKLSFLRQHGLPLPTE